MQHPSLYSRLCLATLTFLCLLAVPAGAQTFTVLDSFTGGSDGAVAQGLIADAHGNLFGVNTEGGSFSGHCAFFGCGNVYELSPNSSGGWTETVLYTFTGGSDGAGPESALTFDSAGNLYGTTVDGGYLGNSNCGLIGPGCGVVFKLSPNSDGTWTESVIHAFHGAQDGFLPETGVALDSSGNVYGTTSLGGGHFVGEIFEISPNGSGGWIFKNLHSFTNGTDGGRPLGFARDANGNLFASTTQGGNLADCGSSGCGTVFELSPNGLGGWTSHAVHVFAGRQDGGVPAGISVDQSGNVFGATFYGGHSNGCLRLGSYPGCGVIFELSPKAGGGWTDQSIYFFTGASDGANPSAAPSFDSAGNVYGTSNIGTAGCPSSCGAVYKLSPVSGGWSETTLYAFTGSSDGAEPYLDGILMDGSGNIFGSTTEGGTLSCTINGPPGCGVVYEITP